MQERAASVGVQRNRGDAERRCLQSLGTGRVTHACEEMDASRGEELLSLIPREAPSEADGTRRDKVCRRFLDDPTGRTVSDESEPRAGLRGDYSPEC